MKLPIIGRCLCAQISFSIMKEPKRTGLCHCRSCQIKSGSSHIAYMAFEIEAVKITGSVKWYKAVGDSGKFKQHGFCSNCGSNLFAKPDLWSHILVVYAGALDNPETYKPQINIWMQDALAWICLDHKLEGFNKNPG